MHIGTKHGRSHSLQVTIKKAEGFEKCYELYRVEKTELREKRKQEREAEAVATKEKNASGEMPALEPRESEAEVAAEETVIAAEPVVV